MRSAVGATPVGAAAVEEPMRSAIAGFEEWGSPPMRARTQDELGRWLLENGRRADAEPLLDAARATFVEGRPRVGGRRRRQDGVAAQRARLGLTARSATDPLVSAGGVLSGVRQRPRGQPQSRLECGTPLAGAARVLREERKLVTALFCDLAGTARTPCSTISAHDQRCKTPTRCLATQGPAKR